MKMQKKTRKKHPCGVPSISKPPLKKTKHNKSWIHEVVEGFFPLPKPHTLQAIKQFRFRLGVVTGRSTSQWFQPPSAAMNWERFWLDWSWVEGQRKAKCTTSTALGKLGNGTATRVVLKQPCESPLLIWLGNVQWHAFGYLGICIWHHVFCHNKCIPCGKLSIRMTNLHTNQRPIWSQETWSCLIPINVSEQNGGTEIAFSFRLFLDYHL